MPSTAGTVSAAAPDGTSYSGTMTDVLVASPTSGLWNFFRTGQSSAVGLYLVTVPGHSW
ncbi:MAG TPA: hypothetical protein VM841_09200 [Actinomycetota bacterium]|nr:hypothetical protein [Actinomycetota bacterium]